MANCLAHHSKRALRVMTAKLKITIVTRSVTIITLPQEFISNFGQRIHYWRQQSP